MSASEDLTGTLSYVEKKIARATMIPRENGEVWNSMMEFVYYIVECQTFFGNR